MAERQGNPHRDQRRTKLAHQEHDGNGDMPEPDMSKVLKANEIGRTNARGEQTLTQDELAEKLRARGIIMGEGFDMAPNIPDPEPDELDEPADGEDPALQELIDKMQMTGGNADEESEDHNDGEQPVQPAPHEEKNAMATEQLTERQKARLSAASMLKDIEHEVKTHEEQVSTAEEDAEEVRRIRSQQAALKARGLTSAAQKAQVAMNLIIGANPMAKTILDREEAAKKADRQRQVKLAASQDYEAREQELNDVARGMREQASSQTFHEAIKAFESTRKPQLLPPVFLAKGVSVPGPMVQGKRFDMRTDMVTLPAKGAMQGQLVGMTKQQDAKTTSLAIKVAVQHGEALYFDQHPGWGGGEPGIFPLAYDPERGGVLPPLKDKEVTDRFFALKAAYAGLYGSEKADLERQERREKAAKHLETAMANSDTNPMAFVLEGNMGQAYFDGSFTSGDVEKHLCAVTVRRSPEEINAIRQTAVKTLQDWLNGASKHPNPNALKQEEEALTLLTDKQRQTLERITKQWTELENDFNVEIVAWGPSPTKDTDPRLFGLRGKRNSVARIGRGEDKEPWDLTLHHPVLMKVEARNLAVTEENPEGHGGVMCTIAKACIPYREYDEMVGQAQDLGRLMRVVVLAGMSEAHMTTSAEAKVDPGESKQGSKHRHRYSRDNGICSSCGAQKPEASE